MLIGLIKTDGNASYKDYLEKTLILFVSKCLPLLTQKIKMEIWNVLFCLVRIVPLTYPSGNEIWYRHIVFLFIVSAKLPAKEQGTYCRAYFGYAFPHCLVVLWVSWLMTTNPIISFIHNGLWVYIGAEYHYIISRRAFLIASVTEIHHKLEGESIWLQLNQNPLLGSYCSDQHLILLSFDSVITAADSVSFSEFGYVGAAMTIMVTAVVLAVMVMLLFSGR